MCVGRERVRGGLEEGRQRVEEGAGRGRGYSWQCQCVRIYVCVCAGTSIYLSVFWRLSVSGNVHLCVRVPFARITARVTARSRTWCAQSMLPWNNAPPLPDDVADAARAQLDADPDQALAWQIQRQMMLDDEDRP